MTDTRGMGSGTVTGREEVGTRVADALPVALASLPLFGGLGAEASAALEQELEWLSLLGGHSLFEEGDPSDALYVLVSGVLGVVAGEGRARSLLAQIHPGETVGEMAMLSERPRSATIIALRDSTLLRIAKHSFARMMETHPSSMRYLSQLLVDRLDRTTHREKASFAPRTLGVIPLEPGLAIERFAADLAGALRDAGTSVEILDARARVVGLDALHALEKLHQLVIYRGDWQDAAWTRLCIRHADHILLVARASSSLPEVPAPAWGIADLTWRVSELVLLQESGAAAPAPAAPWLARSAARAHYHIRAGNKSDFARLGRYIRGRAVGLVLSGGGARGYGHLGVVKALREAGVPLDLVGGTSFGAIVAAGIACEWDDRELRERVHDAFVRSDPLSDYTFPFVALTRGREVARRLRQHFGEERVEDLWRPYFAVATNLTRGEVSVERQGALWNALLASSAIPGLVPPVIRRGEVLVDGAVMNNLPVDIMSTMRRGPIIAVDVARYLNLRPSKPARHGWLRRLMVGEETAGLGIVSLLLSSAATASDAQARLCRELADLLIEPPLTDIGLRDWRAFDRAVEEAYRYTMTRIEEAERLGQAGADVNPPPQPSPSRGEGAHRVFPSPLEGEGRVGGEV